MLGSGPSDGCASATVIAVRGRRSQVGTKILVCRSISIFKEGLCERGDSNPHGFTRQILSPIRVFSNSREFPQLQRLIKFPEYRSVPSCWLLQRPVGDHSGIAISPSSASSATLPARFLCRTDTSAGSCRQPALLGHSAPLRSVRALPTWSS
jgi:hypothetical protein